mgnify:CR=1 FL=1
MHRVRVDAASLRSSCEAISSQGRARNIRTEGSRSGFRALQSPRHHSCHLPGPAGAHGARRIINSGFGAEAQHLISDSARRFFYDARTPSSTSRSLLETGLGDRETLRVLVSLTESGVNPEALAAAVKELRSGQCAESQLRCARRRRRSLLRRRAAPRTAAENRADFAAARIGYL